MKYNRFLDERLNDIFLNHKKMEFEDMLVCIRKSLNLPRIDVARAIKCEPHEIFRLENGLTKTPGKILDLTLELLNFYGIDGQRAKMVLDKISKVFKEHWKKEYKKNETYYSRSAYPKSAPEILGEIRHCEVFRFAGKAKKMGSTRDTETV